MTRVRTQLSPLRLPGRHPDHSDTHEHALEWLSHIEMHDLGDWLMLPRSAAFAMAPSCLEPHVPLERKARIIALLAAQLHPDALAWLKRLCHRIDPSLRPLAQVAWEQAAIRTQAFSLCIAMHELNTPFITPEPYREEEAKEALNAS
ncbi:MAG: hypothetical protein AAFS10_23050 [Myxococcota bacterium]